MKLGPTPIRKVLVICGMLPVRSAKAPRYRGSTTRCQPGNILVTDGKTVNVQFTAGGELWSFNWQAMVDQATACHTAVVVTETECADGVRDAFESSCAFLGRPPQALIHDNKPIHDDQRLREHIEKTTKMIPATLQRPENKAVIEGEFGKYEQAVGTIYLDDSSKDELTRSAVGRLCVPIPPGSTTQDALSLMERAGSRFYGQPARIRTKTASSLNNYILTIPKRGVLTSCRPGWQAVSYWMKASGASG